MYGLRGVGKTVLLNRMRMEARAQWERWSAARCQPFLRSGIRRSAVLPMAWLCASAGAQTGAVEAEAGSNGCDMSGRLELSIEGFGDRKSDNDYFRLEIPRVENTSDSHGRCYAWIRLTEQSDPHSAGFDIVTLGTLAPGADGGTVNGTTGGERGESGDCHAIEPGEYCADIALAGGSLCWGRHTACLYQELNGFNDPSPGQYYVHVYTSQGGFDNSGYYDLVTLDGTLEALGSSAFMDGWGFQVRGNEVSIEIERIENTTHRTTMPLYVTLWLTTDRDPAGEGYVAARHRFTRGDDGRLGPGESFDDVTLTLDFALPPRGYYYAHLYTSQHPDPDQPLYTTTSTEGRQLYGDDHGDSRLDATRVSLPSQTSGESNSDDYSDKDYFRFEVSARGAVLARTTGGLDTVGAFYDADGSLAFDDNSGEYGNFLIRRELDAGAYYVSVSARETGAYTLHLGVEPGDSRSGAVRVSLPSQTSGEIYPGDDEDYFRFEVSARGELVARTTGGLDTVGALYDADGAEVTTDDDGGEGYNFRIRRELDAGAYYVRVSTYGSRTGAYALHLSIEGSRDDHGDSRPTATRVSLPSQTFGVIDPSGDYDYFRFEVSVRGELVARTTGRLDTVGALYDADGTQVGDNDNGGEDRNFRIRGELDAGAYYVSVSARETGAYTLHLGVEPGDSRSGAVRVSLPSRTFGEIYPGDDEDYFRFEVSARGELVARTTGGLDTVGALYDADGAEVATDDDGGTGNNFRIRRELEAGTYYVRVSSWRAGTGVYVLHLIFGSASDGGGSSGAPTATAIANRSLATGGDATLDLADHFSDDQTLVYEARSSDAEVVRVSVTSGVLTLMPVAAGSATVTVTARDPDGNEATQTFSVTVGPSVETFRDCDACPEMVAVPAGTFTMGAPYSEAGSRNRERPVHAVTVPSFAVGVYEVTFDEWDACVADGGCNGLRPNDSDWGRGRRPVIWVSWEDAQRYVEWLSSRTGERYRLPSESEWEYVARAGTTTPFHTGETITPEQANYDGRWLYPFDDYDPNGLWRLQTVPVGSFDANAFGLHDVHGNVREWVQDCWNDGYGRAPTDGSAWLTGDCDERVLRGGSWSNNPSYLRSALRLRYATGGYRYSFVGFRVVRTLAP